MIITDPRQPDNPIVFANNAFCRMTGYSAAEIIGRNCRFLQGSETDQAAVARIRDALASARQIEVDIRNHRKNGQPFWNRLLISPVHDATGQLAYFFASQLDVTFERERLQNLEASNAELVAELGRKLSDKQASEDELKFTLAAGRFGSWSLDFRNKVLTASDTCRENFGFAPNDRFDCGDLLESIHPVDRDQMQSSLAHSIKNRSDYTIECRISTPAGERRAVAIRGRPVYGADGTPLKMAGVSLDITERIRSERMKEGLADLSERLMRIDQTGDISYAAGEILGFALDIDRAGYGTVDGDAETITIERDWNAEGIRSLAGVLQFRDYGSYIEDLLRGDVVAFADAELDPRTRDSAHALKAISAQAVVNMPVVENGRTVALFYLNHGSPREWREDELAFLREVASRTRIAVERRKVEFELRAVNRRLTFLDELGKAAADAVDAESVMAITTRLAGQKMNVSICAYADMEPDQDHFTIRGDWSAERSATIVGRYRLEAFGKLAVHE
ncbi:MAG: PAS domain-containing protein, partial [Oxalobacteraceae bacterium]